jgi:hypothetical protein
MKVPLPVTVNCRLCGRLLPIPLCLALALLFTACTDIQPIVKIGVLAPFEGLHRRSGYAALAAVRVAIADYPALSIGVLPLALDDGNAPVTALRSAQKLLVDPRVVAVVGPLNPALAPAVGEAMATSSLPWRQPYAPAVDSTATPASNDGWAIGLVQAAVRGAARAGATALVLAGWTPGWPALTPANWTEAVGVPVRFDDNPANVQENEAVFWLGSPEDAADYLAQLRQHRLTAPFWMGPQGDDPVFAERATTFDGVFWAIWSDAGYNSWVEQHATPSPTAYLVYKAAVAALRTATNQRPDTPQQPWFVQTYAVNADGSSERVYH